MKVFQVKWFLCLLNLFEELGHQFTTMKFRHADDMFSALAGLFIATLSFITGKFLLLI